MVTQDQVDQIIKVLLDIQAAIFWLAAFTLWRVVVALFKD